MKAYKVTLLVIDHENMGEKDIKLNLENEGCTNPRVMAIETADIGKWSDNNPLNDNTKCKAEFNRLFGNN